MKIIYANMSLNTFQFWGEGKRWADEFSYEQMEKLDEILSDEYPQGLAADQLNKMFAEKYQTLFEWLGVDLESEFDEWWKKQCLTEQLWMSGNSLDDFESDQDDSDPRLQYMSCSQVAVKDAQKSVDIWWNLKSYEAKRELYYRYKDEL